MIVIGAVLGVAWVVCGVLNYGLCLGYLQRRYPELAIRSAVRDRAFALNGIKGGPIALWATLIAFRPLYGFLWRPLTQAEVDDILRQRGGR